MVAKEVSGNNQRGGNVQKCYGEFKVPSWIYPDIWGIITLFSASWPWVSPVRRAFLAWFRRSVFQVPYFMHRMDTKIVIPFH